MTEKQKVRPGVPLPCYYCGRPTLDSFRKRPMCFACHQTMKTPSRLADRSGDSETRGRPMVGDFRAGLLTMNDDGEVIYADQD